MTYGGHIVIAAACFMMWHGSWSALSEKDTPLQNAIRLYGGTFFLALAVFTAP